ncbi:MAG: hypothetical protein J0G96_04835 [Flavobacteriia bacterium]|mgnify:CR=1 FL=1|nr:hypothetical protein [Flavobacteriia bacterium]OJX35336.1 MAG: hypothetical protein BGO87_12075 [Flavobacteriia bacterium 40-80]
MVHRGEIVEQAVRRSGVPITTIAKRLGRSRRWMYLMFDNPDVPIEIITRIGQIIYYDFHSDFPSLFQKFQAVEQVSYDLKHEGEEYWKNKYFALLEEYNSLLKKFTTEK